LKQFAKLRAWQVSVKESIAENLGWRKLTSDWTLCNICNLRKRNESLKLKETN